MSGSISSMGFAAPVSSSTIAAAVSDASGGAVSASLISSLIANGPSAGSAAGMEFLAANGVELSAIPSAAAAAAAGWSGSDATANAFAAEASSINNAFVSAISSSAASGSDPAPALQSAAESFLGTIIIPNSGGESLLTFLSST